MRQIWRNQSHLCTNCLTLLYSAYNLLISFLVASLSQKLRFCFSRGSKITPVIVNYMKNNLEMPKPRYSQQILPVPWPFVISRFHCIRDAIGFYWVHAGTSLLLQALRCSCSPFLPIYVWKLVLLPTTVKLVFNRQCQAFNLNFLLSRQIKLLFDVNRGYYLCMFKFANLNVVLFSPL